MKTIIRKFSLIAAVSGLLAVSIPAVSNAETIILNATEDSGVLDGDNTNNPFPGIIYSELDTAEAGNIWLSVLKFDLSPLAGMTINSASLELTSNFNHNAGTFTHQVFSSTDDSWMEGTVTGVNRPLDSTLTLLDSTDISGISQTYSWDVLSGVLGRDGLAGTNNFLTLLIRPDLSQAGSTDFGFGPHFNDRTSLSGFPQLVISPVPAPAAAWLFSSGLILIGFFGLRKNKLNRFESIKL